MSSFPTCVGFFYHLYGLLFHLCGPSSCLYCLSFNVCEGLSWGPANSLRWVIQKPKNQKTSFIHDCMKSHEKTLHMGHFGMCHRKGTYPLESHGQIMKDQLSFRARNWIENVGGFQSQGSAMVGLHPMNNGYSGLASQRFPKDRNGFSTSIPSLCAAVDGRNDYSFLFFFFFFLTVVQILIVMTYPNFDV